ncbi:MAG: hypothetical protein ABI994_06630 [Gemmatimonadales bacterium]
MAAQTMTGEMQDDKSQNKDQGDDPEAPHPAWRALVGLHHA